MIQLTQQFALFKQTILNDTRSVGIQLLRFIFALVLGLIVYLAQSEASRWREIDGLFLFEWIFGLNLFFSLFAGLFLFLPIIKEEKEEDTLGMIMMTGISPFAYLFGKLGSRLFIFTLMLTVQIPVISFCITMGGISIQTILLAYLLILVITFHLANIFLLGSLMSTSLFSGVIISGGIIIIFCYIFNIISNGFELQNGNPLQGLEHSLRYIFATGAFRPRQTMAIVYMIYLIITGIIFFFLSVYYFDTLSAEQEELELPKKLKGKESSEEKAESLKGVKPKALLRKLKTKRFGKWPIIYKDFRFNSFGPFLYILQFTAIIAIFYEAGLFEGIEFTSDPYSLYRIFRNCFLPTFLLCGASILISSNLIFASELKHKTLNSLILLPLECRTLYFQKLFGIFKVSFPSILTLSILSIGYLCISSGYRDVNNDILIISTILCTALFLNSFLSLLFTKFSFFLSCGITTGWFFLQIFFFEMMNINQEDGLPVLIIGGFIISVFSIFMSIQQLKKHGITS